MTVKLIAHTPSPDFLAGRAAAICVGGDLYNVNACNKALKGALAAGHTSVAEHATFTFLVEGISRVTLAQLTRHRLASFSVESQRYVNYSEIHGTIPDSIMGNEAVLDAFRAAATAVAECYVLALGEGIPAEDARFILPEATSTRLFVTMNARELLHFFELRCCNRAQWEIRKLADEMLRLVKPVAPIIFENAGPACARGKCPEAKPCGKPRVKTEWDEAVQVG